MIKMTSESISRRQLFEVVHASNTITEIYLIACKKCMDFLLEIYAVDKSNFSEELQSNTSKTMRSFLYKLKERWTSSKRVLTVFLRKNKSWLDNGITLSEETNAFLEQNKGQDISSTSAEHPQESSKQAKSGRPIKVWEDLSERSRKRKAQNMLTQNEPTALLYAASQGAFKKNRDLKYVNLQ